MYVEQAVASITDIPAAVAAIAATAGWSVAGTVLTRAEGGISVKLEAFITGSGTTALHELRATPQSGTTKYTRTYSPRFEGGTGAGGAPLVKVPSKIHVFAGTAGGSYLAIVVEYGYNLYRHMYIGSMAKRGSYTGGEVICANYHQTFGYTFTTDTRHWTDHKMLFCARQNIIATDESGWVHVVHADNATYPFRTFRETVSASWEGNFGTTYPGAVLGGATDGINAGLHVRGQSTYAGGVILTPINLFTTHLSGADILFRPIGAPLGVRLVNVRDIDPGAAMLLGSTTWRCFPEFSKNVDPYSRSLNGKRNAYESSYYAGLAYPET